MRVTISEIARVAGVSATTVDRVINGREGVRVRTRDIVMETAARLGYFGPTVENSSSQKRLDFLLPGGPNSFMRTLKTHLLEQAKLRDNVSIFVHEYEVQNPDHIAGLLRGFAGSTDAVGLVAPDDPQIREEINTLTHSGVHVATLVSDIPAVPKVGYIGVDNRAAGRVAGMLMGRFLQPAGALQIAMFIGSHAYRGHEEREMGFRSILSEEFPELRIASTVVVADDRDRAYRETQKLLDREQLSGIYNIGSGNQGIAQALRERQLSNRIVFIGHDFTSATRVMLLDRTMDAVVDQNPRVQAREIVRMLVAAANGQPEPEFLPRLQVVFRENIPSE